MFKQQMLEMMKVSEVKPATGKWEICCERTQDYQSQ